MDSDSLLIKEEIKPKNKFMDYIRIKSQSRKDAESQSRDVVPLASQNVAESPSRQGLVTDPTANSQQPKKSKTY